MLAILAHFLHILASPVYAPGTITVIGALDRVALCVAASRVAQCDFLYSVLCHFNIVL